MGRFPEELFAVGNKVEFFRLRCMQLLPVMLPLALDSN